MFACHGYSCVSFDHLTAVNPSLKGYARFFRFRKCSVHFPIGHKNRFCLCLSIYRSPIQIKLNQNLQYIIKGLIILVACSIDMRKYLVRK